MEVTCATTIWDGKPHVRLRGDLDFQSAPAVRATLQSVAGYPLSGDGADALVLDITDLKYIDSSGISALVSTARQAQARGRDLRLVGASPHVQLLLSATGFTRFFHAIEGGL